MQEKLKEKSWLLIADGEALPVSQLQTLAVNKAVMVLDGAYAYVREAGLKIDVLLGDFDTISSQELEQASLAGIFVVRTPDQDKTDLQKGLLFLDDLQAISIDICAATGKRLQHTLYNLRMLKKFYRVNRLLRMFSATEVIYYEENTDITIEKSICNAIAILGFPNAVVTSVGLQYELLNLQLDFEKFNSVSNRFKEEKARFKIAGGVLFICEYGVR